MTTWGAVDMGSSAIRIARARVDDAGAHLDGEVHTVPKTASRRAVVRALRAELDGVSGVGVSIAGPTDPSTGTVLFAGAYPWAKGPFGERLTGKLGVPVTVVNDAVAHLHAHRTGSTHPLVCCTLGTALGFALTDAAGEVRRPRPDADWELGHVFLTPPATGADGDTVARGKVAWALGHRGLDEAQEREGADTGGRRFATDLAPFVFNLAMTFQPRTVVLAGGITASIGEVLTDEIAAFVARHWPPAVRWDPPVVLRSPYGGDSGLLGAAVVAASGQVDGSGRRAEPA